MTNIAKILKYYLNQKLPDIALMYNDAFPESEGDMIITRHDPSQAAQRRFSDGSRLVVVNLSYHARYKDAQKARDSLQKIIEELDGKRIQSDDTNLILECEALSLPQFINYDEKNQNYYTVSISVEYTEDAKN